MATRRERVILELQDDFTTGMAKAAAAAALLDRNLNALSGTTAGAKTETDGLKDSTEGLGTQTEKTSKKTRELSIEQAVAAEKASRLRKSIQDQARALVDQETGFDRSGKAIRAAGDEADDAADAFRKSGSEIDRMSGRLRLLTDAALTLGPALIPIGAAGVPALMALTAGFGAAAGAAGVALIAFNGVGDGLKALNEYQLAPTEANLAKLNEEMAALGPAGASFVRYLDDLEPQLRGLQQITRAGLFPGVQAGIDSLLTMLPQVRVILFNLSTAFGGLAASAGAALSGDGFAGFFDYLEHQAGPLLTSFAHTLGNVTQGFASLIVAFSPMTGDFASGMERMSAAFADWAAGVSKTQGFADFVAYLQRTGPQVVELLGAMGTAFIGILQAAAPVGEALLPVLTSLARVLGAIAASPIGPPLFTAVAALLAVNRAASIADAAMLRLQGSAKGAGTAMASIGKGIEFGLILAGIEGIDLAFDKLFGDRDVNSTTLMRDLEALSNGQISENLGRIGQDLENINSKGLELTDTAFGWLPGDTTWDEASKNIGKVDEALAQLVEGGRADTAASAMEQIAQAAREQGVSVEEIAKWFPQYNTALDNSAASADSAAAATENYAEANDSAARVTRMTRAQVQGLVEAMEEQVSAALGAFDAVTQYARALEAAQKQAKQSNAGINASTEAGRKNRDALSQLAAAWNNQGAAVRNNMGKWREARAQFIAVATQMGATGQQARNLADRLMEIPRQRQIDIKLYGSEEAASKLERIRQQVMSIPREWRTTYYVNQVNSISRRFDPSIAPEIQRADGGEVPGPRQPYGDKVLAYLAPGEEVITNRNGEADRFRRDRAAGRIPAYANGGTVEYQSLMFGGTAGGRLPNTSQLYGIDQAFLSVRELAERLGNLSAVQLRSVQRDIDLLGKRDLTKLSKALDVAAQSAKEHADAVKADMASLRSAVTERLRSDLFADQNVGGLQRPDDWASLSTADRKAFLEAQMAVSGGLTQSPVDILRNDIAQARELRRALRAARQAGINGAALAELAQNADVSQIMALVSDPRSARLFDRLYDRRSEVTAGAGRYAADAVFGKAWREARAEYRETTKAQRETNQRLDRLEKLAQKNPDKTGDAVADALDKGAARATRKGGRP